MSIRTTRITAVMLASVALAPALLRAGSVSKMVNVGEYGRVSWTSHAGSSVTAGYLYAARQADKRVYVYFVIQSSGQPEVSGWGLAPPNALSETRGGGLQLTVDTRRLAGFTLQGSVPGSIAVTWASTTGPRTVQVGASGLEWGNLTHITSGQWIMTTTVASGSVLGRTITSPETAEMGTAGKAMQELRLAE